MDKYVTVFGESTAEYVEKRSRFIATLRHCETEKEALNFIAEMRGKYWDANHNVFAFSVEKGNLNRFSDDGEPHGTAGKPVLDIITSSTVSDIAIVVTRYFGGVLLGTGGLVRAYSGTAKQALENAEKCEMVFCTKLSVVCDYSDFDKLTALIKNDNGMIENSEYTEKVTVNFILKDSDVQKFNDDLIASFSAKLVSNIKENCILPFKI